MSKNETQTLSLTVTEGLTVTILPSLNHEFLMSSKEVARGFGVTEYNIRQHKFSNSSELIDGKHFITAVSIPNSEPQTPHNKIYWTKRGVTRLGFFIKSKQAKIFRDWAEDLIIKVDEQKNLFGEVVVEQRKLPSKRNHNRLTHERLLNIMADVCRIDDKELRLSLSTKLMQGGVQC